MKTFNDLIDELRPQIKEIFPWDLEELLADESNDALLIDIREPYEYDIAHLRNSINVPRGILEAAAEWDYEDTVPALASARDKQVILLCRSGNRTVMAAHRLQQMGFKNVISVKTGLRGWSDDDRELVNNNNDVCDPDECYDFFNAKPEAHQLRPA